ncbi:MAG: hypothetical protein KBB64_10100 [Bacteroidia bacterium]|nr:hypothetical protein [Bacteroidia bacterium]
MLFRYLVLFILFTGLIPKSSEAQLAEVACPLNYEQKFDDEKIIKALNNVCHETNLRSRDGYLKAIGILRGMLDTMQFPPLSLTDWKDSLLTALDVQDPAENNGPLGSCCLPDNHCEELTRTICENRSGSWQEGVKCDAIACSPPPPKPEPKPETPLVLVEVPVVIKTGACLLPDGSCMYLAEHICSTQNGVFKGEGVKCEESIPVSTAENTETNKEVQAGITPAPDSTEPQPMWACCPDNPDDECSNTTEANCKNGQWLIGVKCESANCKGLPGETAEEKAAETELSDTEMDRLRKKGENKVEQLKNFIDIISNKSTSTTEATQAIELAVGLFDSEERTVTVSSLTTSTSKNRKVRVYFNRLKQLPYTEVKVEWANFQYTSKFKKGNDGKYYGYVTFEQRFTGYIDGIPVYQDKIERNLTIVISKYQKIVNGNLVDEWDVFLGDMAISERR